MKRILRIVSLLLVFTIVFACTGCSASSKKYSYTHENGNRSAFNLDFDKLTGTYEGYPIDVVLRNNMNYKKVGGAIQNTTGTLTIYENGYDGWYVFKTNHWEVHIIVDNDNSIRCYINGRYYTFNN